MQVALGHVGASDKGVCAGVMVCVFHQFVEHSLFLFNDVFALAFSTS